MGLNRQLANLPDAITTDTSNNVGIGGSPSGSYKLDVTGTGRFSGALGVNGAVVSTPYTPIFWVNGTGGEFAVRNNGQEAYFHHTSAAYFGTTATGSTLYITSGAGATALTLASTGAATFSSSVTAAAGGFYPNGVTSIYLQNNLISGGSTSGITGLYMGDTGSGINVIQREKVTNNTARIAIYSELGYNTPQLCAFFQSGYNYQNNNSTVWNIVSDIRIKENIRPINDSLLKILALKPCHFEYKNKLGKTKTGFIAQEFEQVLPNHVHEMQPGIEYIEYVEDGENIKVIDADLIPYLVSAIQEQQATITSLQDRLIKLENK